MTEVRGGATPDITTAHMVGLPAPAGHGPAGRSPEAET